MRDRSRGGSSSTSRSTTRTYRRISDAARWIDRVGIVSLLPVSDVVLPSLWEAVSGRHDVDWAVRRDDGKLEFTPEMDRCWRWKDELPERRLACVGNHLGRWKALVAPRLVPALHAVSEERRAALGAFEREVADAVAEAGPCTAPQLRKLLGAEKKAVEKAVGSLQRALVLTSAGVVEQQQGWGAVAVDLVTRRWELVEAPEAAHELVRCVLASCGQVSAADVGGALGWRLNASRTALDELVERRDAVRRLEAGLALYASA